MTKNQIANEYAVFEDALESRGNSTGTEHQLDDLKAFMDLLFEMCSDEVKEAFLMTEDVVEFIDQNR